MYLVSLNRLLLIFLSNQTLRYMLLGLAHFYLLLDFLLWIPLISESLIIYLFKFFSGNSEWKLFSVSSVGDVIKLRTWCNWLIHQSLKSLSISDRSWPFGEWCGDIVDLIATKMYNAMISYYGFVWLWNLLLFANEYKLLLDEVLRGDIDEWCILSNK